MAWLRETRMTNSKHLLFYAILIVLTMNVNVCNALTKNEAKCQEIVTIAVNEGLVIDDTTTPWIVKDIPLNNEESELINYTTVIYGSGILLVVILFSLIFCYQFKHNICPNMATITQKKIQKTQQSTTTHVALHTMSKENTHNTQKTPKLTMFDKCKGICQTIGQSLTFASKQKRMYLSIIPHILDTATDIGVILQFYFYLETQNDCQIKILNLDANILFILSLLSLIVYRIITGIYLFFAFMQQSIVKALMKFILSLLDLEIISTIKINIKCQSERANNPQRLIEIMEGCFESAPQAIIQTVYLWHTEQFFQFSFFCLFLLYFFFVAFA